MPRPNLMSWEGAPNFRWTKMYKGQRFKISCDDLGVPRTKAESQAAANDWWLKTISNIPLPASTQQAIANRRNLIPVANVISATKWQQEINDLESGKITAGRQYFDDVSISPIRGISETGKAQIQDRLNNQPPSVPKNKTIGHNLDQFLRLLATKQAITTHHELSEYLNQMTDSGKIWARNTDVTTINAATVNQHYLWLSEKGYTTGPHNKVLGFFRRFVRWLDENELLPRLPKNLMSKDHRKEIVHKKVEKFPNAQKVINALKPRQRLWAYLGLNCGCTNADLGKLTWEMIDKKSWTLTRRRVKTGDNPNTPTVTYKLFPEVVKLLNGLDTKEGLIFKTKNGLPMYVVRLDEKTNRRKKKDMFSTSWNRLSPKPEITLDRFRSIAATALRSDPYMAQYIDYFLAHAPHKLNEKHYAAEDDDPFFKALEFIRKKVLLAK